MSILVMGSLHHDVVVRAERMPVPGETLIGADVAYVFGGKGGNQAVAAALAGARVAMAGRVGADAAADVMLRALDEAGVDRSRVRAVLGATGMSVAIVEANGENAAVVVSGVNLGMRGDDFVLPDDLSCVLLQNELPAEANGALLARLPRAVRVIFNAAPARALPPGQLRRVDILIVNRVEAEMMTAPGLSPLRMAQRLRAGGPDVVIVTLGGEGLICLGPDGSVVMPAEAVAVQSTHGAGDVFCGTFAAFLDSGASLEAALNAGQKAAAHKVAGG